MFPLAARVKEMLTTFSKDELDPESDGFYLYCESTRFANDYADAVLIVSAFIKANRQMKMESLLELYEEAAIERIEDEDTKPSSPMDAFCKAVKPGKEQS